MMQSQLKEDFSVFALLIRIEKSNKIQTPFQSAYIQIQHIPIRKTQLKSVNSTSLRNQYDTVWVQDFIYEYVQQGDQFIFKVMNNKHKELGSQAFAIDKLMPYYNTGQTSSTFLNDEVQKMKIEKDGECLGEVIVVFSLFQKKDLLAGIYQPNYSLSKSNKQWLWLGHKPDTKTVGCGFCNCIQEYQMQDLPELRVNRVKIQKIQ